LLHTPLQQAPFALHVLPSETHPPSVPNGLPESPMVTPPLLLLLLLAPLLLLVPPLLPPLLLLVVESPPPSSPPPAPLLLLLPQAMNELPETSPTERATHTTSALRRRNMRRTVAGVVPTWPSPRKELRASSKLN
jgi:hypothetical protein